MELRVHYAKMFSNFYQTLKPGAEDKREEKRIKERLRRERKKKEKQEQEAAMKQNSH